MPEGHTVHRLAAAFRDGLVGGPVRTSSPQGRFTEAAQIDRMVLLGTEAVGKHLFLAFAPSDDVDLDAPVVRWVHVHLGLYGSWTFAGEPGFAVLHAIGAPRVRVGEQESALPEPHGDDDDCDDDDGDGRGAGTADWRYLLPRPTTRLRIQGPRGLADLTGPTACELLDGAGRQAIIDRLGPDPLREDADPERFVRRVLASRTPIATLLMNQQVVAGIGNIYRAELLFRARLDPFVPGTELGRGLVEGIWDDLVALMRYGARTGRIVTTQPEHRLLDPRIMERTRQNGDDDPTVVPREQSFYVYHRHTLPCRLCGTDVRSQELAGRTVYWCPGCQKVRSRKAAWIGQHPAAPWALEAEDD